MEERTMELHQRLLLQMDQAADCSPSRLDDRAPRHFTRAVRDDTSRGRAAPKCSAARADLATPACMLALLLLSLLSQAKRTYILTAKGSCRKRGRVKGARTRDAGTTGHEEGGQLE
jgi:hypothetical protein